MTNNFRILSIAIVLILTLGIAMPQPAHAGFVGSMVSGAVDSVKGAVSGVVDTVKGAVGGVVDTVKNVVGGAVNTVTQAYESIKDTVKGAIGSLTGSISGGLNAASGAIQQAAGSVASATSGLASSASSGAMELLSKLADKGAGLGNGIGETLKNIDTIMKDKSMNLFEKVQTSISSFKDNLSGVIGGVDNVISQGKDTILNALKDPTKILGPVIGTVKDNPIIKELMDVGAKMADQGKVLLEKYNQAAASAAGGIVDATKTAVNSASKAFNASDFGKSVNKYTDQMKDLVLSKADAASFNKQYGTLVNAASDNGSTKSSALLSFAGLDIATKNNVDDRARGVLGATDLTTKVDGHLGLKLDASVSHKGENYEVSAATRNVVGLSAYGEGSLKWMEGGTVASASGKAQVAAGAVTSNELSGKVKLSENFGAKADVVVNGLAGADASVKGNAYLGRNGIELSGGAEARAGLWADAAGSTGVQYKGQNLFTASGTAGAGLGVGAGVKGGAAFRLDKVGFNASVTLGPVKLGGGIYVNPQAVAQLGFDKGKQAVNAVGSGLKKAGGWVKSWFD